MIGKTITHYKIIEKLGGGGMGVVYKAEDTKLKRTVALKFLPPVFSFDQEAKKRFINEAQAASSLDHNNICNIHEIGETDDGQVFICMNCYDGETLKKKIERGQIQTDEAVDIIVQVAAGLQKAHEKGIIHRDIKPANIFITNDGVVKILDFGLAKLSGQTMMTKMGETVGTIAYMSPEQTRGELVDQRTDIWSLGVVLYEMLTRNLPFKGDYDSAMIYSILNEEPKELSSVPKEIQKIISKCLTKNPSNRYQNIDDLFSELNKFKKVYELKELEKQPKDSKNRIKWIIASAVTISLSIVVIFLLMFLSSGEENTSGWVNSIAVLPFSDLSPNKDQEYFCDGMTDKILTDLSKLKVLKVIARTSVMKFKNTNKTISEIGKELQVNNVLEGSIFNVDNRMRVTAQLINTQTGAHIWAENYERKIDDVFDIQDDISEKIASELLANLSPQKISTTKTDRPINIESYNYYLKGDYLSRKFWSNIEKNIQDFYTAEHMFLKAIEFDSNYALAYAGLADLYDTYCYNYNSPHLKDKEKYMLFIEKNTNKAYALDSSSSYVCRVMATLYIRKSDRENSYLFYKKSLAINDNDAQVHNSLGLFLASRGLNDMALKHMSRAIELNPLVPYYFAARGNIYRYLGKFEQAEVDFKKALEFDPNHEDILGGFYGYIDCLIGGMNFKSAKNEITKYLNLFPDDTLSINYFKSVKFALDGKKEKALQIQTNKLNTYLILKMKTEAINYLFEDFERLKVNENPCYSEMKNQARFDLLRSDIRFQEILAKNKELYEANLIKYGDN